MTQHHPQAASRPFSGLVTLFWFLNIFVMKGLDWRPLSGSSRDQSQVAICLHPAVERPLVQGYGACPVWVVRSALDLSPEIANREALLWCSV